MFDYQETLNMLPKIYCVFRMLARDDQVLIMFFILILIDQPKKNKFALNGFENNKKNLFENIKKLFDLNNFFESFKVKEYFHCMWIKKKTEKL